MSDEELIDALRKNALWVTTHDAADRIEQLVATNEALVKRLDDAIIKRAAWELEAKVQQARAEKAEAERDAAVEAKLDAISTLDAWFDRRKLGHKAVDQAVVDAASGYLRTSRVGGMPQEESDLIIGVIQDMARLGLFADLFARAALKENSHE